jgi:hypothetical protein
MPAVQPPTETPAERYARDYSQIQGDWQHDGSGNLVYTAAGAAGARLDRTLMHRGGDNYYTYDVDGNPVPALDVNGRNEREYVDYDTGESAVAGAGKSDRYDELKANS